MYKKHKKSKNLKKIKNIFCVFLGKKQTFMKKNLKKLLTYKKDVFKYR